MKLTLTAVLLVLFQLTAMAQGTFGDYKRAKEIRSSFGKVYRVRLCCALIALRSCRAGESTEHRLLL